MAFEVIGYDEEGEPIYDEVEGYEGPMHADGAVMGEEVIGYDDDGSPIVVGRRRPPHFRGHHPRHRAHGALVRVHKPHWRHRQLAPGVIAPDQGMLPLPLNGSGGTNTFSAAVPGITFEGQLQKPFRGERLLFNTVRTGVTAVGRVVGQLFVGTDLQQLDVPSFDLEQVGQTNAFGVRLTMKPAQPGVFIRIVATLTSGLTAPDTILCTCTLLGRLIH